MAGVIFDTSALIQLAAPSKPFHLAAREYYDACLANSIPMYLSAIAVGEFQIKQPITDLPLQNFRQIGYETNHAIQAARLYNLNQRYNTALTASLNAPEDTRRIIINDLKIFAQAEEDVIPYVLTGDRRTLARMVTRLRNDGLTQTQVLVLSEGYALSNLGLSPSGLQTQTSALLGTSGAPSPTVVQPPLI